MLKSAGIVVASIIGGLFAGGPLGLLWTQMLCSLGGLTCEEERVVVGGMIGILCAIVAGSCAMGVAIIMNDDKT